MTQQEIRAAMILRDVKIVSVARSLGVTETAVRLTMKRKGLRSTRIRKAIAQAISKKYEDVWGEKAPSNAITRRRRAA